MIKPIGWKQHTDVLKRRLEHLIKKEHQNSFDKQEISALIHVLDRMTQPLQIMPDGKIKPIFDEDNKLETQND